MEVIGQTSPDAKSSFDAPFNREDNTKKMNGETNNEHKRKEGCKKTYQTSLIGTCTKHARTSGVHKSI